MRNKIIDICDFGNGYKVLSKALGLQGNQGKSPYPLKWRKLWQTFKLSIKMILITHWVVTSWIRCQNPEQYVNNSLVYQAKRILMIHKTFGEIFCRLVGQNP